MMGLVQAIGALVFVLALIGLVAWLMRRFGPALRLGRVGRLRLVETIALDSRRRLVLVRRDETEHLLMIGGAGDVVIETGIDASSTAPRAPEGQRGRAEPRFAAHLPGDEA
jgi:flagellar protein FliO/FliZ